MEGITGGRGAVTAIIVVTAWFASACAGVAPRGSGPDDSVPGAPAAVEQSARPSPSPAPIPVVEKKTVTETVEIPFERTTRDDPTLAGGKRVVATKGVAGVKTLTFEVTYTDGAQTDKKLLSEKVTKAPIAEVTRVGTKTAPPSNCDPNYTGACVPIASDVDCAGGSGNGPAYVRGPVYVVGQDIYDLDSDNDGIGCE